MIHNLEERTLFPTLPVEKILELCKHGEEVTFQDGEALFREGERNYNFYIILEGSVRVTKKDPSREAPHLLTVHQPGQFTGELSMMTGAPAIATGYAVGTVRAASFTNQQFRLMVADCPELAGPVLIALAGRARQVDAAMIQQEKLASLGKMSAALAHELNNPAAAMVRSAQAMRDAVQRIALLGLQYDSRFTAEQRPIIQELQKELRASAMDPETLSPLERTDREESIAEWLEEHGVADAWDLAPGLTSAGMTRECAFDVSEKLPSAALAAALTWFEADLTTNQLTKELEASACRISDLVKAMKQYTYMDQAQFQEIDVHVGLDSTLKIFGHKLRGSVEVRREYDRSLPKFCAYAGELNQVWTNLISNAVDAMNGKGILTVSTRREGDCAVVTIADNGPGIPPEVQERMFQPFFTTKAAGHGTGLGLEITQRIVVNRHNGTVAVQSEPGNTRFEVRLPLSQKKQPVSNGQEKEASK